MIKVLHITTHMGGGVGKAISDLTTSDTEHSHTVIILEKPEKWQFIDKCKNAGVVVKVTLSHREFEESLRSADIAIIHWWHHPLMYKFLFDFPKCEVRLILWSHVSGCTYPYLSYRFLSKFHRMLFTSRCSFGNSYWSSGQQTEIGEKAMLVYGLGRLDSVQKKRTYCAKENITVGYIGTLAKSKIHPEFVRICHSILQEMPQIKFVLIGDKEGGQWIEDTSRKMNIDEHIECKGYCRDVNKYLSEFDIFGYPLNPYHFGTTENSVLEAMAAGLPVVLMNQLAEQYIIDDGVDGLLSGSTGHYKENILALARNYLFREQLGRKASLSVFEKFNFTENLQRFTMAINETVRLKPKKISFRDVIGNTPLEWFVQGMNQKDRDYFEHLLYETHEDKRKEELQKCPEIFREKTKGSVVHFASIFPMDEKLKYLRDMFV